MLVHLIGDFEVKFDKLNKDIKLDASNQSDLFAIGSNWAIKAESLDDKNYYLLLNSSGTKCMNKKDYTKVTYLSCGTKDEGGNSW